MPSLDNLTNKILEDSKAKARQIIGQAEEEARNIIDEEAARAHLEKERVLEAAATEAKRAAEQVTAAKKLSVRDDNLRAKQSALDSVFQEALDRLNQMEPSRFESYLYSRLASLDCNQQQIILPENCPVTVEEINQKLKASGKDASLQPYQGSRRITGGFALVKDGIEQNYTFDALLDYYRYELESEVLNILY